jgi:hypothetical protein
MPLVTHVGISDFPLLQYYQRQQISFETLHEFNVLHSEMARFPSNLSAHVNAALPQEFRLGTVRQH